MTQRSIIDRSDRVGDVATQDLYIDTPIIDACVYEDNLGQLKDRILTEGLIQTQRISLPTMLTLRSLRPRFRT